MCILSSMPSMHGYILLFAQTVTFLTLTCSNFETADMTWVQKAKPGFSLVPVCGLLDGD